MAWLNWSSEQGAWILRIWNEKKEAWIVRQTWYTVPDFRDDADEDSALVSDDILVRLGELIKDGIEVKITL